MTRTLIDLVGLQKLTVRGLFRKSNCDGNAYWPYVWLVGYRWRGQPRSMVRFFLYSGYVWRFWPNIVPCPMYECVINVWGCEVYCK